MALQLFLLLACALFGVYDAAYVDSLRPCALQDKVCLNNFMQTVIRDLSNNGIPEYNIPPIDPLVMKNIDIPILNLMNMTIVEAVVKGIKDCDVISFDIEPSGGKGTLNMVCDIEIKGKSKILGTSSELQSAFGSESIHGDGNFEIKLTKLQSTLNLRYHLILKDGQVYVKDHPEEFTYKYDLGDAHISADNIYLGDKDESELVVDYLNKNWRLLEKTFGNNVVNFAMNGVREKLALFADNVPAKYFVSDNLITYVRMEYSY